MTNIACSIGEIEKFEEKARSLDFVKLSFVDLNGVVNSRIVQRCFIKNILTNAQEVFLGISMC